METLNQGEELLDSQPSRDSTRSTTLWVTAPGLFSAGFSDSQKHLAGLRLAGQAFELPAFLSDSGFESAELLEPTPFTLELSIQVWGAAISFHVPAGGPLPARARRDLATPK
jgi:hypothetical protein